MLGRIRRGLTFSNVCSFLALTIALGTGGAYAANTVGSDDIIDDSIQSVDIKDNAVTFADIAPGTIGTVRLQNGGVANVDLHADAVDSSRILDATVANADIATGAVDGKSVLNESLTSSDLAPDSVGSSELANDAVGSANVATDSLTLSDLAGSATNGAISLSGISNGRCTQVSFSVGGAQVGDSAIVSTGAAIQNGIVLYANRVSSAGHLEVNACNFSGTSMTPISNFPVRIVTFR